MKTKSNFLIFLMLIITLSSCQICATCRNDITNETEEFCTGRFVNGRTENFDEKIKLLENKGFKCLVEK